MDDNTKCVLIFLIAAIAVVVILHMLLSQGSTKGQTLASMTRSFNRARAPSQKVFAAFASFGLLLKAGAWGAFGIIVVALIDGVVRICTQSNWSLLLAIWDRLQSLFTDRPAAPQSSTPPT
jgi:hypothetical protein